jgi:enoyl-CoA hydratase
MAGTTETGTENNAEVLFERRGQLGVVTLNRPRAVNALTAGMVEALLDQLTAWADDDGVATVVVRGAGERGLCAGGDIVAIYEDIPAGGGQTAGFWQTEYRVNSLIARYPKPYVAFMDGLVLGGGVGISAHGSVRVVTERTRRPPLVLRPTSAGPFCCPARRARREPMLRSPARI